MGYLAAGELLMRFVVLEVMAARAHEVCGGPVVL
jgi:hypothetical protein